MTYRPFDLAAALKDAEMRTTLETITPEAAAEMLSTNYEMQRRVRPSKVEEFAQAIVEGRWIVTHQGIAFSADGKLLDGQHRLHGIIRAGVPVRMSVTRGLSVDAFNVIDVGITPRTSSDVLGLSHAETSTLLVIAQVHSEDLALRLQPLQMAEYKDAFLPAIQRLINACPTTARIRSSAPVKAAAVLRHLQTADDYPLYLYRSLVLMNFAELPTIGSVFIKQISHGKMNPSGFVGRKDLLARSWTLFDKQSANYTKLAVKDADSAITQMGAVARRFMRKKPA